MTDPSRETNTTVTIKCLKCGVSATVPRRFLGQAIRCAACKTALRLSGTGEVSLATPSERRPGTKGPLAAPRKSVSAAADSSPPKKLIAAALCLVAILLGTAIALVISKSPSSPSEAADASGVSEPGGGNDPELPRETTEPPKPTVPVLTFPPPVKPASVPLPPRPMTKAEIIAKCEDSIAFVSHGQGTGTGFLVAPRLLVTNAHVIQTRLGVFPDNLKVCFPSLGKDAYTPKQVVHFDEKRDLAILMLGVDRTPISVTEGYEFLRGEDVVIIGNPGIGNALVLQNAVSPGLVSTQMQLDGMEFLQIGASVNPGNSGGPVISLKGKVIAMVTLKASAQEGIAFGVPAEDLRVGIENVEDATEESLTAKHERYLAQTTYRRLHTYATTYTTSMDSLVAVMDLYIKSGKKANDGIVEMRVKLDPLLKTAKAQIEPEVLQGKLQRLQGSKHLGPGVMKNLLDLWTCSQQARSYVEEPRGNFTTYSTKTRNLRDEFDRLKNQLTIQLGVSFD